MRTALLLSAVILSACAFTSSAQQCAVNITSEPFTCSNSAGCHQTIDIESLSGYGETYYVNQPISCCGIGGFPNFVYAGWCQLANSHDPVVEENLRELAKSGDFLSATCRGHYLPLTVAAVDRPVMLEEKRRLAILR